MSKLNCVHHLSLTVTDLERSVPWYQRVLDLEPVTARQEAEAGVQKMALSPAGGGFVLVLVQYPPEGRDTFDEHRVGMDHVAFGVSSKEELAQWERRLANYGVTFTPAAESSAMPGATLVGFRDPDGIRLEVWADAE